jgi:hypothetical protein
MVKLDRDVRKEGNEEVCEIESDMWRVFHALLGALARDDLWP